jgi:hypothetical protein
MLKNVIEDGFLSFEVVHHILVKLSPRIEFADLGFLYVIPDEDGGGL